MTHPLDLTGRVILVTGASSGIGLATSILLSQLGAKILLMARSEDRLSAAISQLDGSGHRVTPFDLSAGMESIPETIKALSAEHGPLSGLVHCAGLLGIRPLRILATKDIETLFRVNVTAALMLVKGFRQKGVHAQSSAVVLVSSVMGLVGAPGRSAYCASKSALHSMAKSLALELAPEGIRVNCVAPGFVRTPMLEGAEASIGVEALRRIEEMHPLGFGEARDVGHAISFLLSDASRWVTGSILTVDGGYTAH
jgi:NAD(P)-dependent dehydrogenase (short-subunit alcohol dehydrogenase family)